jgi:hypothetical protein
MTFTAAHRRSTAAIKRAHRGGNGPYAARIYVATVAVRRDIPNTIARARPHARVREAWMQCQPSRRTAAVAYR